MNHAVESPPPPPLPVAEREMTFAERAVAAAGAAVMLAVVVNPLDVAKVCTVLGGEYVRYGYMCASSHSVPICIADEVACASCWSSL
jgi:solute carrier family 25, member 39/40